MGKKSRSKAKNKLKLRVAVEKELGLVSIVIPNVKQTEMVKSCVQNILSKTGRIPYELIVVDDGSSSEVQRYLSDLASELGFKLVLKEKNEGFGRACNIGIKEAKGDKIVILNTDVFVEPGWLNALVKVVERDDAVGIVGARLLYPNGDIQHAGIYFDPVEGFNHRCRGLSRNHYDAIEQRTILAVTFALVLITRKLIDAIGPLDESFFVSMEDVDYCMRAWEAGFKVVYCPSCVAVHLEGGTRGNAFFNKDPRWLKKEIETQEKFYKKWGSAFDRKINPELSKAIDFHYRRLNTPAELTLMSFGVTDRLEIRKICDWDITTCG